MIATIKSKKEYCLHRLGSGWSPSGWLPGGWLPGSWLPGGWLPGRWLPGSWFTGWGRGDYTIFQQRTNTDDARLCDNGRHGKRMFTFVVRLHVQGVGLDSSRLQDMFYPALMHKVGNVIDNASKSRPKSVGVGCMRL